MNSMNIGEIKEINGVKIQCVEAASISVVDTCQKCCFVSKINGKERCLAGDLRCHRFLREDRKNAYYKKV